MNQASLVGLVDYNPETGIFTSKVNRGAAKQGKVLGSINSKGYIRIFIKGKEYLAHRLAFIWMTGECPKTVDHVNRDKSDNRWCNLRSASSSENQANKTRSPNNSSGYKNVQWREDRGNWIVNAWKDHKKYYNGSYDQLKDAVAAANDLRKELYGEFALIEEFKDE